LTTTPTPGSVSVRPAKRTIIMALSMTLPDTV
jgi:hypothetical protein